MPSTQAASGFEQAGTEATELLQGQAPITRAPDVAAVELTVIVPTRNERANIAPLLDRIEAACPTPRIEVLFVDDSTDETAAAIEVRGAASRLAVRLIHRPPAERDGGLGGAVVCGLRSARGEFVCVIDADLQHPPELIADLLEEARSSGAAVVVASRYAKHGDIGEFGAARRAVSRAASLLARLLFPRRLAGVSDPLSGFFLVRRDAIEIDALRPNGFKILLEILLSGEKLPAGEVPFRFGERQFEESKASAREGALLVWRLVRLRSGRIGRFALVGASGVAVNSLVLAALTGEMRWWYLPASLLASEVAILWNFALSERYVFKVDERGLSRRARLASFVASNTLLALMGSPLLVALVSGLAFNAIVANLICLVLLFLVRFAVADRWIWAPAQGQQVAECESAPHSSVALTPIAVSPEP